MDTVKAVDLLRSNNVHNRKSSDERGNVIGMSKCLILRDSSQDSPLIRDNQAATIITTVLEVHRPHPHTIYHNINKEEEVPMDRVQLGSHIITKTSRVTTSTNINTIRSHTHHTTKSKEAIPAIMELKVAQAYLDHATET